MATGTLTDLAEGFFAPFTHDAGGAYGGVFHIPKSTLDEITENVPMKDVSKIFAAAEKSSVKVCEAMKDDAVKMLELQEKTLLKWKRNSQLETARVRREGKVREKELERKAEEWKALATKYETRAICAEGHAAAMSASSSSLATLNAQGAGNGVPLAVGTGVPDFQPLSLFPREIAAVTEAIIVLTEPPSPPTLFGHGPAYHSPDLTSWGPPRYSPERAIMNHLLNIHKDVTLHNNNCFPERVARGIFEALQLNLDALSRVNHRFFGEIRDGVSRQKGRERLECNLRWKIDAMMQALGVLCLLAPQILEALGYGMDQLHEETYAAWWVAKYARYLPMKSPYPFFMELQSRWSPEEGWKPA